MNRAFQELSLEEQVDVLTEGTLLESPRPRSSKGSKRAKKGRARASHTNVWLPKDDVALLRELVATVKARGVDAVPSDVRAVFSGRNVTQATVVAAALRVLATEIEIARLSEVSR